MPYDSENRIVYGPQARRVRSWSRGVLLDYLEAKLNDPDGPYYNRLGLSEGRHVVCTGVGDIAEANYADVANSPVVFAALGPKQPVMPGGRRIGGVQYKGSRHSITLALDMAVAAPDVEDFNPDNDDTGAIADADEEFAEFVCDCLERGFMDLTNLGLQSVSIEADDEAQRAGIGRNPHRVSFLVMTLDDYEPTP